ncbi:MAG TPA: LytTR family DNA-binding domain-containing protein [Mucilaginibacter sp.]|jgi:two-component system LytT family response regulator|nr:LytTR family DNA-binding domain-containing protein [Mucilaginibacter sp.]
MIRCVIVDDEQHCINRLGDLLDTHCKHTVQVAGAYNTLEKALSGISEHKPDLVFLDIQLNDSTGFDLLSRLPAINFEVVFTTAYDSYAVKAFKFNAIDYLLKPIDPDDLVQAVNKIQKISDRHDISKKFDALFHDLKSGGSTTRKITVPTNKGLIFLSVDDIVRCEANVNYTTIFLKDKQQVMVAKTLKDFDEMLDDYQFFRIHNSHLINLNYVRSYHKGKGGYVTLTDNTSLEVSTRRRDLFLKKIAEI